LPGRLPINAYRSLLKLKDAVYSDGLGQIEADTLTRHGLVDADYSGGHPTYRINQKGKSFISMVTAVVTD